MPETQKVYRALVGMNYTPKGAKEEVRLEPGDTASDIPKSAIKWLVAQGYLEEVKE
jgi:hypothetical protein